VLGGVGKAAGLRGKGMGEGSVSVDGVAVSGRIKLRFDGDPSYRLVEDCGGLLRFARPGGGR
jgi:hypothetical protein